MERLRQRQSHIEMAASGITAQLSTGLAILSAGAARDKGKELAVIDVDVGVGGGRVRSDRWDETRAEVRLGVLQRRPVGRPRPVLLRERPAPHRRVPPRVRVADAADRADAFAGARDDTSAPTSAERDEEAEKAEKPSIFYYILPELDCSLSSKQYYKVFVALGMSFCLLSLFIISRSVFVDAGVAAIDIETKKRKEEMKAREAKSRAAAEHGDLALITVEGPKTTTSEKIV
ncbi:hypothetical protein OsJ_02851 [Oryza sativa Japonica Group]|uniref:Uncharacterized protein n=1 Tax=Oryza sativa subsp. japonica TaxID=39947 RepID=B9EYD4_ORYSJ|nr:hypothetical protein OsJ_02851 [Oryza sativa Japonica Group]